MASLGFIDGEVKIDIKIYGQLWSRGDSPEEMCTATSDLQRKGHKKFGD